MIYPITIGHTVNSLNTDQKGIGYFLVILIYTIFEKYPSPLLFNELKKLITINPRISLIYSLLIFYIGTILFQFTCYFRFIDLVKINEKNKRKKEEEKEMKSIEN